MNTFKTVILILLIHNNIMAQDITTVKIDELATRSLNTSDYFIKGEGSIMYKNTLAGLVDFIGVVGATAFKGALAAADTPTEDGFYFASESKTYTNAGGLVVDLNAGLSIISVTAGQTVFKLVVIPIDLSSILDSSVTNGEITKAPTGSAVYNFDIENVAKHTSSKSNIFDTDGFFTSSNTYNTSTNWRTITLPVLAGDLVHYNLRSGLGANLITLLDSSKVALRGVPSANVSADVPQEGNYLVENDVYYIALSVPSGRVNESSYWLSTQYKYGRILTVSKTLVPNLEGLIFSSLTDAVTQARANDTIYVNDGIYDEYSVLIPDKVSVIGVGNVEIRGVLPASSDLMLINETSTIDMNNSGHLENITVRAQNMRYPVHADFGTGNTVKTVVNCKFIHHGNQDVYTYRLANSLSTNDIFVAQSAWGGGTMSGDKVELNNVYLKSPVRAFSTHNNVGFSTPSEVKLNNVEMVSKGVKLDGSDLGFQVPVFIQSLASGTKNCKVIMNSCVLNEGYIVFKGSPTIDVITDSKNVKQIWNEGGSAYSFADGINTLISNINYYPFLTNEMNSLKNVGAVNISRGQAVKRTNHGISLMTSADAASSFFGVAMADINIGSVGVIMLSGYLIKPYLNITADLTYGQEISVDVNGNFIPDNSHTITLAVDNQNVKL